MAHAFVRQDFLIKDLAVSIGAGRGGTWLPVDDEHTPPTPISPIAGVVANLGYIEAVRGTIAEAVKANRFEEIATAFVADGGGGSAVIRSAIFEIGAAVVASAAFAELGGTVGLVNPDCGGTSFETIPPTITPVVHVGATVHRVAELPRLRRQLADTVAYLEKAAAAQAPRGEEVPLVRRQLESALEGLDVDRSAESV